MRTQASIDASCVGLVLLELKGRYKKPQAKVGNVSIFPCTTLLRVNYRLSQLLRLVVVTTAIQWHAAAAYCVLRAFDLAQLSSASKIDGLLAAH